jgi:hypothetical protein
MATPWMLARSFVKRRRERIPPLCTAGFRDTLAMWHGSAGVSSEEAEQRRLAVHAEVFAWSTKNCGRS